MTSGLIGFSGFVGGTLLKQSFFEARFRSTDIADIAGRTFDTLVCAGAPAQKWLANREPEADRRKVHGLMEHLRAVRCRMFVLISTVDVFKSPVGVDETAAVDESGLEAYGLHRRQLEKFVESQFPNHLTVRLPGLVGPGLRKNVVFDLFNENNLAAIDCRSVFQFYPMVNLWYDIQQALRAGLKVIHLTAEPVSVAAIAELGFGRPFQRTLAAAPANYDLRTRHAEIFGAKGNYQYTARETIQAVRAYAQSESPALKSGVRGGA